MPQTHAMLEADKADLRAEIERLRAALDNSQSLLVATLLERPSDEDLSAQIVENRKALTPGFFLTNANWNPR
jgi:hypothetical protein